MEPVTESHPMTIVLADDSDDMIILLDRLISHDPRFEVVGTAHDGEETVRVVKSHQPDVVILDLGMPLLDGVHALPQISEASPDTKIVVHSALPIITASLLEHGAEEHVAKEEGLDAVRTALGRVLRQGSSRTAKRPLPSTD